MEYIICAIQDRSVNAYINLHCVRAEGQAIRQFQDAINNPDGGTIYKHPDDYDLYRIGTYDDNTATITPQTPAKIGDGKQLAMERT